MNLAIENIIRQGENLYVEFKQSFNEDVIETLCAFANAKGGTIYIGVANNGKISGVTIGKETIQQWLNEIKNKTEPFLLAGAEVFNCNSKQIVALSIASYPIKPISIKGRCYKRVENSNQLLSISEVVNIHLQSLNTSWDAYPDPNHSENDISMEKIMLAMEIIRNNGISVGNNPMLFLQKYNLVRDGKITNAAYLLFKKVDTYETAIELGRFQNEIVIKDTARTKDDVIAQVEQVLDFVKKHINKELIFKGEPRTTERWQYPLEALREIIVNMIVHRDYRSTADSIVKIFNNKIEFYNPGTLPPEITIEDLWNNNYRSNPRNKVIADFFKDMRLIEKVGTGIKRIIDYFKEDNLPLPEIRIISGGIMITVFAADIENDIEKVTDKVTENRPKNRPENGIENSRNDIENTENDIENMKNGIENGIEDTVYDIENVENDIENDRDKQILYLIEGNSKISTKQLAENLNISWRTLMRALDKLKTKGILERIGPDKGGYWKIIEKSK